MCVEGTGGAEARRPGRGTPVPSRFVQFFYPRLLHSSSLFFSALLFLFSLALFSLALLCFGLPHAVYHIVYLEVGKRFISQSTSHFLFHYITFQVAACLFLGSCFTALKDPNQTEGHPEDQSNHLTQFSFLSMLDSRVGLTRFVDMLRKPLTASR